MMLGGLHVGSWVAGFIVGFGVALLCVQYVLRGLKKRSS